MSATTTPTTTARQAPSNVHPTVEVDPKRSSPLESSRGGSDEDKLLNAHTSGVLRAPQALVVSNDYGEKDAPALKDPPRVRTWAEETDTILVTRVESNADEATVEHLCRSCWTSPTLLYIGGHTDETNGALGYLPSDGFNYQRPELAKRMMRQWLIEPPRPMKLTMVTDICECPNFLGLPFAAEKIGGIWEWKETAENPNNPPQMWDDKQILHFASADEGQEAYQFKSTGGIYTRGFCNLEPCGITLGERLDYIQSHMNTFFRQYQHMKGGELLQQRHRLYSSFKPDFNDPNVFETMGLC